MSRSSKASSSFSLSSSILFSVLRGRVEGRVSLIKSLEELLLESDECRRFIFSGAIERGRRSSLPQRSRILSATLGKLDMGLKSPASFFCTYWRTSEREEYLLRRDKGAVNRLSLVRPPIVSNATGPNDSLLFGVWEGEGIGGVMGGRLREALLSGVRCRRGPCRGLARGVDRVFNSRSSFSSLFCNSCFHHPRCCWGSEEDRVAPKATL